MGLFARRKQAADGAASGARVPDLFDFAAIGLPRSQVDPTAGITVRGQTVPLQVSEHISLEGLAAKIAPMNPFLLAGPGGRPVVLIRLDGLQQAEVDTLTEAVRDGRSLLAAHYRSMPTYPVLVLSLAVYDQPDAAPFVFEGLRDIVTADVQDFLVALGKNGGHGTVWLYAASRRGVALLSNGPFALQLPPTPDRWKAHRTTPDELKQLWQLIILGAAWLQQLKPRKVDFPKAADAYFKGGY